MITRLNPNTIHLGGEKVLVNDLATSEVLLPGLLIETFLTGTVHRYRRHATAGGTCKTVALDQPVANKGVDDFYSVNDLVEAGVMAPGATVWGMVASGQNIVAGAKLESNGDGTFKAGTTNPIAIACESKNGFGRIRVEFL